jgi:hypothetical protein
VLTSDVTADGLGLDEMVPHDELQHFTDNFFTSKIASQRNTKQHQTTLFPPCGKPCRVRGITPVGSAALVRVGNETKQNETPERSRAEFLGEVHLGRSCVDHGWEEIKPALLAEQDCKRKAPIWAGTELYTPTNWCFVCKFRRRLQKKFDGEDWNSSETTTKSQGHLEDRLCCCDVDTQAFEQVAIGDGNR